jgi:hypothetical protein
VLARVVEAVIIGSPRSESLAELPAIHYCREALLGEELRHFHGPRARANRPCDGTAAKLE